MSNVSKIFVRTEPLRHGNSKPGNKTGRRRTGGNAADRWQVCFKPCYRQYAGRGSVGRVVEIRRSYEHGTPPLTMADVRDERSFYNILQEFEQLLYRGLLKAERQYSFIDYQRITDYFFKRLNRAHWDGKRRRWNWQEGVQ